MKCSNARSQTLWVSTVPKIFLLLSLVIGLASCSLLPDQEEQTEPANEALYLDEFVLGKTGSWLLEGDDIGRTSIVNEQMVIQVNNPQTVQYTSLSAPIFDDFVLEVDGRLVTGDPASTYGILFRMQSPEEFYRFEISGTGLYIVERHDSGGQWARLLPDWQDSEAIGQGLNARNRLKLVAIGPTVQYYVNDVLLGEFSDTAYTRGNIGLDAGTFGKIGLEVAFDNLIVTQP